MQFIGTISIQLKSPEFGIVIKFLFREDFVNVKCIPLPMEARGISSNKNWGMQLLCQVHRLHNYPKYLGNRGAFWIRNKSYGSYKLVQSWKFDSKEIWFLLKQIGRLIAACSLFRINVAAWIKFLFNLSV